jgi:hypothetical protein
MTRQEALRLVSRHVAGLLIAGDFEEASGLMKADAQALSEADADRISWAIDEVQRRLYRMGGAS